MNVKQLKESLQGLPEDMEITLRVEEDAGNLGGVMVLKPEDNDLYTKADGLRSDCGVRKDETVLVLIN